MSGTLKKTEPSLQGAQSTEPPAWFKDFQTTMGGFAGELKSLRAELASVRSSPAPQQQQAPIARQDDDDRIDPNVLETMSRAEFLQLIGKTLGKQMQKQFVEPLSQQLSEVRQGLTTTQLKTLIEQAQSKYPDLLEYQQEMTELAKVHKTLGPEQLYKLAKDSASEEKLAEVAKKFPPKVTETKKPLEISFGGLMPSNHDGSDGTSASKMSPREAADDAWAKTVADLGGEPAFTS